MWNSEHDVERHVVRLHGVGIEPGGVPRVGCIRKSEFDDNQRECYGRDLTGGYGITQFGSVFEWARSGDVADIDFDSSHGQLFDRFDIAIGLEF